MPKLVRASFDSSINLTVPVYERLLRRIERLERQVLKKKPVSAPKSTSDNRPFQAKSVENNTVKRINKVLKSDPKGINALTAEDYKFYRQYRHRFV